jgi:hypothetical protein
MPSNFGIVVVADGRQRLVARLELGRIRQIAVVTPAAVTSSAIAPTAAASKSSAVTSARPTLTPVSPTTAV